MSSVCPFCQEAIEEDLDKCPHCGEALYDEEGEGQGSNPKMVIIVIGGVFLALCCVVSMLVAIATPGLIGARKQGNETAAIGALKTISSAQALFREADKEADGVLDYADLYELGQVAYIDAVLGSGVKNGYVFDARPSSETPEFLWFATAEPQKPGSTGDRYFATNHEGVVWYSKSAPIPMNALDCKMPQDRIDSGDVVPVGR